MYLFVSRYVKKFIVQFSLCQVILKVLRSLLNEQQWAGFGNNPKEELLTHERILLQTIKFDLQIDHPYSFILRFAKELKGNGE